MAGSSARRARRLNALSENAVDDKVTNEGATNDKPGGRDEQAVRKPLNRTAARRPTAARPAAKQPAGKQPAAKQPATDRPTPVASSASTGPSALTAASTETTDRATLLARFVGAIDQRRDPADRPVSSLRMRDKETSVAYVVAAVQVVVPVVFLTVTTGKGAPAHPLTLAPAIGLVLALAMAASIRLSNRILTAFLAVTSTLATTSVGNAVPLSVRSLSTVDLLAALLFAMWITLRQSKARNAVLAERRKANQAVRSAGSHSAESRGAGGRRGRKAAEAAEPTGPPPSARYTPPKNRP